MTSLMRVLNIAGCCSKPATLEADRPTSCDKDSSAPRDQDTSKPLLRSTLRCGVEVEHQGLDFSTVAKGVGKILDAASPGRARCRIRDPKSLGDKAVGREQYRIAAPDGRVWRLDSDAGGVELVSPVLQGNRDLHLLQSMVAMLRDAGGSADEDAGLHVHVDAHAFTPQKVQSLIALMVRNEHWLYPVFGIHASRRRRWCKPISEWTAQPCLNARHPSRLELACLWGSSRSVGLNLKNYLNAVPGKNTIEFRYLNGTVDPVAVGCAVGFYTALAERALQERSVDAETAPSSLSALLADIGIEKDHPVAVHMRGLLCERIASGWDEDLDGPLPDLATLVQDDVFVSRVCRLLDVEDTPRGVARATQLALTTPLYLLERAFQGAPTLVRQVNEELRANFKLAAAHRLLCKYAHIDGRALGTRLAAANGAFWSSERIENAIDAIAPWLQSDKRRLDEAIAAVATGWSHSPSARIAGLQQLLALPTTDVDAYLTAMRRLPRRAANALGAHIFKRLQAGEAPGPLVSRLLALGSALGEDPGEAFNFIIAHPELDLADVRLVIETGPIADWQVDERYAAAVCLAPWLRRAGTDLACMSAILQHLTQDRCLDRAPLIQLLTAWSPAKLAGLRAELDAEAASTDETPEAATAVFRQFASR